MKYLGSKNRIAKHILPIILKDRKEGQIFYDLFCGGGNIIDKVDGKRVANDNNKYLIALFKEMQKEEFNLPDVNEEYYTEIKNNYESHPDWLVGYVAFQLSYGAMWFCSYRKDSLGKRNYSNEAKSNVLKQRLKIKDVEFHCGSYDEVKLEPNSIIYCDIPYKNTTQYNTSKGFDYDKFYNWCIDRHNEGHQVFISEYDMPSDKFVSVWEGSLNNGINNKTMTEKLFVLR
jgi:DNA adenine methylase